MGFFKLFIASLLAGIAHGYPEPGACSGNCLVHDPSVFVRQSDGAFFRFSTGNEIQIAKATSLSGPWTVEGSVVPKGSSINLAGNTDRKSNFPTKSFSVLHLVETSVERDFQLSYCIHSYNFVVICSAVALLQS